MPIKIILFLTISFFHIGKLNARDLKLNVNLFDEKENYNKVKNKWLDIIE